MKLWIDDVRSAPVDYKRCYSVWGAIHEIEMCEYEAKDTIELIDIDHDAGHYYDFGGDYIKLLDWLEETGRNYPIRIHSMNPIGRQNMLAICKKNGWKVVY